MSRSKSPHRIFIIDPQTLFRAGLRKILSTDQGFQVVGDAAALAPSVQQIRKLQPHLVLIENSTTGAQTEKAVEQLRQAAAKARIVLLGNSAATVQNGGGVDGVLLKTSSVPSMLRNLRRMASASASSLKKTAAGVRVSHSSKSEAVAPRDTLTPREFDILACIVRGWPNRDIARYLSMREQTVKNYLHAIFDKLGVSDRLELALYAIHHQMVPGAGGGDLPADSLPA